MNLYGREQYSNSIRMLLSAYTEVKSANLQGSFKELQYALEEWIFGLES